MILTVTLNPSLDRTIEVDSLVPGVVNRALRTRLDPGGKGVNVTRALLANGHASRAVVPLGGPDGAELESLLAIEEVDFTAVRVAGSTRSNVTVAEAGGAVTKLNEPGANLTQAELATIVGHVLEQSLPGDWVVLCGSLPPGVDDGEYAAVTQLLRSSGRRVAVDTSGPALRRAVAVGPDLVKPNREELAEVVGRELDSIAAVLAAAHELHDRGVGHVLVSLGGDGAVLVGGDADGGALPHPDLVGSSHVADPRSTVGAGDAFLAGYLSALTNPAESLPGTGGRARALLTALAWGAAA
ncbi:MAG: 1-phosphofructokinase family hexose kinase, partial [Actinomycetota bacterium]|nr:1-phosphofructokinase family hexose kinase [Actinomycetota bacterium]